MDEQIQMYWPPGFEVAGKEDIVFIDEVSICPKAILYLVIQKV